MNARDLIFMVGLLQVPQLGPVRFRKLIERFGSAEQALAANPKSWGIPLTAEFLSADISKLLKDAEVLLEKNDQHGIRCVTFLDEDYPQRLKYYDDAPPFLFIRGNGNIQPARTIGIVGTRNATSYGRAQCAELIRSLQPLNVTVISGLALGIDAQAHKSALECELPTWACMANGHENIYPREHKKWLPALEEQGLSISQLFSHVKAEREYFPTRNRLIAALSDVVIVIESAAKGGALVTANYANDYNKEVFAVPGRMNDVFSVGCNDLIRQNKANLFSSPIDLCEYMNWKLEPQLAQLVLPELNEEEKRVFNVLRKDNPMEVDVLRYKVELTHLPAVLLQMELKGILRYLPGNKVELT